MILINADGLVFGRIASYCAKKALNREEVVVVNAEKAIITGKKEDLLKKFHTRFNLAVKGNPRKGPKASRMPDRMLRAAIKGMLPTKRKTGRDALKRVKVFIGLPAKFEGKAFAEASELKVEHTDRSFMVLGNLSKLLGATW